MMDFENSIMVKVCDFMFLYRLSVSLNVIDDEIGLNFNRWLFFDFLFNKGIFRLKRLNNIGILNCCLFNFDFV